MASSFSLASSLISLPSPSSSPSSSDFPQSASGTSSTQQDQPSPPVSSTTTSTTSTSPSSAAPLSSTPTSSSASTSAVTSTSSIATSAPVAVAQPQSSSSSTPTPISLPSSAGASTQAFSPSSLVPASPTAAPSSTPTHSSSSGFFSNTGAVAGTFTIVGLVCIAGVIAVVMFIANRRHSRSDGEDTEYLDKFPDFSPDPITRVSSVDDGSDHAQYGAPPIPLAPPPTVYYPDHAYALHPQAFAPEVYPQPSPDGHLVPFAQNYASQRIYSPEDYDIAYPPLDPRLGVNVPNPHQFTDVELDSAPVPLTQTVLPGALRPSVKSNPSAPANIRFSVDSFYTGIATDTPQSLGQAL